MNVVTLMQTNHAAFEPLRSVTVDSLSITIEEYRHKKTGAMHYHLAADNPENCFLVALRTVPHDSTGVAHILEHTALCGSEKYPVRDPFFLMLRRSLNTFMNAMTSSDWTAYPFASQNQKDFDNLLSVYLDAVFFSRLDELDFAQEGHRLEFAEPENPESDLQYKGVVFNEMKGAMSSTTSVLWQAWCKHLFPTTTYHFNSGGEPENIPDLSYTELKDFYQTHYHPSNAIFMTFGNIPAAEHQAKFEDQALARFDKLDKEIGVAPEQRYSEPLRVQESYALDEEDTQDRTHIVVGWLLGESADLEASLEAQLLSDVLLDNSASPLRQALETTELGNAPSPLCGLEDSMREMTFVCGLEGSNPEHSEAVEQLVLDVIANVAKNGVPAEQVEAVLHQLELHQREIGGDSYPYGLQLCLTALSSATHRGDPVSLLDLDPVIAGLRKKIADPNFIKRLAQQLLDNPHRLTLTLVPDNTLSEKRNAAEKERLANIKAALTEAECKALISQAKALAERQAEKVDESVLPKVGLDDVPADMPEIPFTTVDGPLPVTRYARGTNGLIYQQLISELPQLDDTLIPLLPLYTATLTELGVGKRSYLETQAWQAQVSGGMNAWQSIRGHAQNPKQLVAHQTLSSKALLKNRDAQTELMRTTLNELRFDELGRIKDLVGQMRSRREMSVTQNGHGLAMSAASQSMSPSAALSQRLYGLESITAIKALDKSLADTNELARFAEQLSSIHSTISNGAQQLLVVAEAAALEQLDNFNRPLWGKGSGAEAFDIDYQGYQPINDIWLTNTEVSFCAKAWPTVGSAHSDAAPLAVLGGYLRNGFLHGAIREKGGAYGGGAGQDSGSGAFRFYSYRDPRLAETLKDFDASVAWLLNEKQEQEQLEQAVLGVISSMDKPGSPAGDAKQDFHNRLSGRTREQRLAMRKRILSVTLDDLRRVAETYLMGDNASTAIVSSVRTDDALIADLGLTKRRL